MTRQQRNLLSLSSKTQWENLDVFQKKEFTANVKAKVAVMFIQATECIEINNFQRARELFIYIADSCMCIKDPDPQVKNWTQASMHYLGLIHRKNKQEIKNCVQIQKKSCQRSQNMLTLNFNKFSNEFQLQQNRKQTQFDKDVLHYTSKINGKIFSYLNVSNNYSLYIVFATYWMPFTLALVLLLLVIVYLSTPEFLNQNSHQDWIIGIPSMVLGGLLIVPLIIIFLKTPEQRNILFFSKVLGEEIQRINQICRQQNKQIQFLLSNNGNKIYINLGKPTDIPAERVVIQNEAQTLEDDMIKNIQGLKQEIKNGSVHQFLKTSKNIKKRSFIPY